MSRALTDKHSRGNVLESQAGETRIIDAEILLQRTFQADPRQGCTQLFRLYFGPLCSHAIRFVYSKQIAEDIVAEVFYKFWEHRTFEKITTSYRAYLFKSVRHASYNYVKFNLSKIPYPKCLPDGACSDPCEILQCDELHQLLEEIINSLPKQCKRVFLLNRMENKRYSDIAAELDISVKAIEAHVSKALNTLREKLKERWSWE
jgi:RNA polymerase sigma-70 factor (ECF subfamily)